MPPSRPRCSFSWALRIAMASRPSSVASSGNTCAYQVLPSRCSRFRSIRLPLAQVVACAARPVSAASRAIRGTCFRGTMNSCAALVVIAPVYFAGPSGWLKAALDRCQMYWARKYVLRNWVPRKRPGPPRRHRRWRRPLWHRTPRNHMHLGAQLCRFAYRTPAYPSPYRRRL